MHHSACGPWTVTQLNFTANRSVHCCGDWTLRRMPPFVDCRRNTTSGHIAIRKGPLGPISSSVRSMHHSAYRRAVSIISGRIATDDEVSVSFARWHDRPPARLARHQRLTVWIAMEGGRPIRNMRSILNQTRASEDRRRLGASRTLGLRYSRTSSTIFRKSRFPVLSLRGPGNVYKDPYLY